MDVFFGLLRCNDAFRENNMFLTTMGVLEKQMKNKEILKEMLRENFQWVKNLEFFFFFNQKKLKSVLKRKKQVAFI